MQTKIKSCILFPAISFTAQFPCPSAAPFWHPLLEGIRFLWCFSNHSPVSSHYPTRILRFFARSILIVSVFSKSWIIGDAHFIKSGRARPTTCFNLFLYFLFPSIFLSPTPLMYACRSVFFTRLHFYLGDRKSDHNFLTFSFFLCHVRPGLYVLNTCTCSEHVPLIGWGCYIISFYFILVAVVRAIRVPIGCDGGGWKSRHEYLFTLLSLLPKRPQNFVFLPLYWSNFGVWNVSVSGVCCEKVFLNNNAKSLM